MLEIEVVDAAAVVVVVARILAVAMCATLRTAVGVVVEMEVRVLCTRKGLEAYFCLHSVCRFATIQVTEVATAAAEEVSAK
jgi:hypothetical protein